MLTVPSSLSNLLAHLISYSFSFICLAENLPSLLPGLSTLTPGTLQNTWFFQDQFYSRYTIEYMVFLGLGLLQVHNRVHGFLGLGLLQVHYRVHGLFRTRFTPGTLQSTWFFRLVLLQVHQSTCFFRTRFTPGTLEYMFFFRTSFTPGRLENTWFFSGLGLLQEHQSTYGFIQDQVYSRYTRVHVFLQDQL